MSARRVYIFIDVDLLQGAAWPLTLCTLSNIATVKE